MELRNANEEDATLDKLSSLNFVSLRNQRGGRKHPKEPRKGGKIYKVEVKAKQSCPGDLTKVMDTPATGSAERWPQLHD